MSTAQQSDINATDGNAPFLTQNAAWVLFTQRTQEYLGIDGEEFLRRWDAGEYADTDTPDIIELYMLIPLVRDIDRDASVETPPSA